MGKKHHARRTSWISPLLVVVRNTITISPLPDYKHILVLPSDCVCIMTCLAHSVFWDLYCAAPERRETCDHSSEAKAFHDYVSSAYTGNCCPDCSVVC